jgi:hypothetical protein
LPGRRWKIRATIAGAATHRTITACTMVVRSVEIPVAASTPTAPLTRAPIRIAPRMMPSGRFLPRRATVMALNPIVEA